MRSSPASKSETATILREVGGRWGVEVPRVRNLMVHEVEGGGRIMSGGGLALVHAGGEYLPLLSRRDLLDRFPSVTVDMGAVRFVCKGANVMRPGITSHDSFEKGQVVCVREERHGKHLAVGTALMSGAEADAAEKGEVVRNIHYVSDRLWEAASSLKL